MSPSISKQSIFFFVFTINALLYALVYFYPLNEFGEPQIPTYLKLIYDLILITSIFLFGFKRNLNEVQIFGIIFLLVILLIGTFHIPHTSITDYLHYTVRNIFFYSLFLFVDFPTKINLVKFQVFHERLFKFILYFGLALFILQKSGVSNPFGFHEWMWEKNRLITSWLNPNSLGFYLIFYLFYFYFKKNKVTLFLGLIAASIFLSGSLTAILGVIFFIGYLGLKFVMSRKLKASYALIILIAIPIFVYLIINLGALDYILFKIDILFVQKSKIHTSVSTRVKNIIDLINYFSMDNYASILVGDFNTSTYRRLDSQYLNIFYNYGLVGLLSYFCFQISILIQLIKNPSDYSKAFIAFSLWLYFIAFNLTAYLYRPNLVVFYYVMLVFTMSLGKHQKNNIKINLNFE